MQQLHYVTILFSGANLFMLGYVFLRYSRFYSQRIPGLADCLGLVMASILYSLASTLAFLLPAGAALYACGIVMHIATLLLNTLFLIVVTTLSVSAERREKGGYRRVFLGIAGLVSLLVATDGLHHLILGTVEKAPDGFLYTLGTGPLSIPFYIYTFGLAVAAVVQILRSGSWGVIRSAGVRGLLLLATVLPTIFNLLENIVPVFALLRIGLFFNWLSVTIITYLFFGYLFTARRMAISVMDEAYVVFNLQGVCVDINLPAEDFI